ncbi:AraC-like DNA-binding protein [Frigoribacterium sp. PhB160]|uniref:AraC family transcriptional regulator n=1 Tax=Frigoribacterium sp. PhB160 TaxID=2485192 RepID=UPI000FC03644|nr:helix-turn-helix domain-containing protein [Frigoribacterium sp. PhB160]ROS61476.1 AraC-like DNA-binding protein [Frigoribacterium sp. PhB160]
MTSTTTTTTTTLPRATRATPGAAGPHHPAPPHHPAHHHPARHHPTRPAELPFRRDSDGGDDLGSAAARLQELYAGRAFSARRAAEETFEFRYASAGDARLSLRTATFLGHLQGDVPWSKDYVVSWLRSGSLTIDHHGGQVTSLGGQPFLLPSETSFSFFMTPHRNNMVHADAAFLEDVATERHGGPAQRIAFDHTATPTTPALLAWRTVVSRATPVVVDPATPPLRRHAAQADLVRAMLDLVPWTAVDVPATLRTPRTARLRTAAEFVQTHADRPLTPADIARAAGMHTRTLQQAMTDHLGASPMTYLRQVRLERVNRELLAASPGESLVSDVARRWGFGNLGRFSAAYVARFGEHPRDTLAR